MANPKNLIPAAHKLTVEEASKGGVESGKTRAARKTLREELIALLATDITDKNGKTSQANVAISSALLRQALKGNTKAFEIIRDTIGEKPVEKVMIAEADPAVIAEVEAFVLGNGDNPGEETKNDTAASD